MGVLEPSKKRYLTGNIEWPSEDFGDEEFKIRISGLHMRFNEESDKEIRSGFSYQSWPSSSDGLNHDERETRRYEAESEMIRRYNYEIQKLVSDYKVRMLSNESSVRFDPRKSLLIYGKKECPIQPNSNQFDVCKFFFEKWPSGELVNDDDVYKGIGENPKENDSGPVRTAALEVNKKTRIDFGFPVFRTPKGQIGVNQETLIKP